MIYGDGAVEVLADRRQPVPFYRQRFIGSAAEAKEHESVIRDSVTRHAKSQGVTLVGWAILMDSATSLSAYTVTTSRRDTTTDDEAIARFATIAADYGSVEVMLKVIEFHREPWALDWRVSPPRPISRQPRSLDHLCSLVEHEFLDGLARHVVVRSPG